MEGLLTKAPKALPNLAAKTLFTGSTCPPTLQFTVREAGRRTPVASQSQMQADTLALVRFECPFCATAVRRAYPSDILKHVRGRRCLSRGDRSAACPLCADQAPEAARAMSRTLWCEHIGECHSGTLLGPRPRPAPLTVEEILPATPDAMTPEAPGAPAEGEEQPPLVEDGAAEAEPHVPSPTETTAPNFVAITVEAATLEQPAEPQLRRLASRALRITRRKEKFVKLANYLVENNFTEEKFKRYRRSLKAVWGIELGRGRSPIFRMIIPSTLAKIYAKCARILGHLVSPVQTIEVSDPDKQDQIAYVEPAKLLESWLGVHSVLEKLALQTQRFREYHLSGRNPILEALDSDVHHEFGEVWDSVEYFASVQRARHFWVPNFPQDPDTQPVFVHFGFFLDKYTVGSRRSQWLFLLNLLGAGRKLVGEHNLCKPVAIFRPEKLELEMPAVFARLSLDLAELAKGASIEGPGGIRYQVFCVVSHLLGDIPALREGLNLNVPASCNYPCIFCHVRNYRSPPALGRCSYACGISPEFARKAPEEYQIAYQNPGRANLSMALSCKSTAGPGSEAPRLLHGLPGVSIPDSVAVDLLHTEFLGESLRHLKFYLKKLVVSAGLRDAALCKKIGKGFHKILKANKITARWEFKDIKHLYTLHGYSTMKLLSWFPWVLSASGISTEGLEAAHQEALELRVRAVNLATQFTMTIEEVEILQTLYKELTLKCCLLYPNFCVLKTHLLAVHLKELILRLGVLRLVWCFRQEGFIRPLKKNYLNVNNRSISKSVTARWYFLEALKEFCQSRSPDDNPNSPSVSTDFGNATIGRYVTLRSGEACRLAKVVAVSTDGTVTVESHGEVFSNEGRLLANLNASPGQRMLVSAGDFAPCVICPLTPEQVEVIKIANRLHRNLATASNIQ